MRSRERERANFLAYVLCVRCAKLMTMKELSKLTLIAAGVERGRVENQDVAFKIACLQRLRGEKMNRGKFLKEVAFHATLDHPHIVPLLGIVDEKERLGIITEFVPDGTLQENLRKKTNFQFFRENFNLPFRSAMH